MVELTVPVIITSTNSLEVKKITSRPKVKMTLGGYLFLRKCFRVEVSDYYLQIPSSPTQTIKSPFFLLFTMEGITQAFRGCNFLV